MYLTAEQTGGPYVFSTLQPGRYLAADPHWDGHIEAFDVNQLAQAVGRAAGNTWQEHASLILLACCGDGLFEWLDRTGGAE